MTVIQRTAENLRYAVGRMVRSIWIETPVVGAMAPVQSRYARDAAALRLYSYPRGIRLR